MTARLTTHYYADGSAFYLAQCYACNVVLNSGHHYAAQYAYLAQELCDAHNAEHAHTFTTEIVRVDVTELRALDRLVMTGTRRGYADVVNVHAVDNRHAPTVSLTLTELSDSGTAWTYSLDWCDTACIYARPVAALLADTALTSAAADFATALHAPRMFPTYPAYPHTAELVDCIDSGYPASVTEILLTLVDKCDTRSLRAASDVWELWQRETDYACDESFCDVVERLTGDECYACDCGRITWRDESTYIASDDISVCDAYCLRNYVTCDACHEYVTDTTRADGYRVCDACLESFNWCEYCDCYYGDDNYDHNHEDDDHECECVACFVRFAFPANGFGTVAQDQRLTIELPAGVIDDRGIGRIQSQLWADGIDYYAAESILAELGDKWQTKRGNYTRRLSRALHTRGLKLADGSLSAIGNIARDHSSADTTTHVEFTRDLNQSADYFVHDDSCWWQSYAYSRCSLKNSGGLAMRSFDSESVYDAPRHAPTGRVWVQPLNAELLPTHDATHAHAYVVYNGYGELSALNSARLVAHLTDKTYRKVQLSHVRQYVNNNAGYLVADQATCDACDSLYFAGEDEHDNADASTYRRVTASRQLSTDYARDFAHNYADVACGG